MRRKVFMVLSLIASAVVGCGSVDPSGSEEVGATASAILNAPTLGPAEAVKLGAVLVSARGLCSGTLLRDNWVLTAAHCFFDTDDQSMSQYTLAGQTRRGKPGTVVRKLVSHDPRVTLLDVALVELEAPFDLRNNRNPNAPFQRNLYQGDVSGLYGQTVRCAGYGFGVLSDPSNTCSNASNLGVGRSASFTLAPSSWGLPEYTVQVPPRNGMEVTLGDSGSSCYLGGDDSGVLTGVQSQARCGAGGMQIAPTIFRDQVATTIGTARSPNAIYAVDESNNLIEHWHKGQLERTFDWWYQGLVGTGWSFRHLSNDGSIIYALDASGNLRWYRHDGHYGSDFTWGARSGTVVASGWSFRHIVTAGEGYLYTVDGIGQVRAYRHEARDVGKFEHVRVGQPEWTPGSGAIVGRIYYPFQYGAVAPSHVVSPRVGELIVRYRDGSVWQFIQGPSPLASSFPPPSGARYLGQLGDVSDMIARGAGPRTMLYFTTAAGDLMETEAWSYGELAAPLRVGTGWGRVRFAGSGAPIAP